MPRLIEAMGAGKVDIGWLAAFSYVLAKDKYDVELLLVVQRLAVWQSFLPGADHGAR
jgi:ABC-type phosphate/phosphonate transport system substrate-binding protein